jgi:hypothetical protein
MLWACRLGFARAFLAAVTALCCTEATRAEVLLSLYTGISQTSSSDVRIREPGSGSDAEFRDVHWDARPFQDSPYYGLRVSYFPDSSSQLGGSVDFTHYKIYADTNRVVPVQGTWDGVPVGESAVMNRRVQHMEVSHGVNLTSLSLLYRWTTRWHPYIGGGPVVYLPHAEGEINGHPTGTGYSPSGFGAQILAGVDYRLLRRISLFAEAKADRGNLHIDLDGGSELRTRLQTLHVLAGVTVHF